jgi:propionyl-CoA synthetase
VLGAADQLKGEIPIGFVVLKAGVDRPHEEIVRELIAAVREKIGPVAAFKNCVVVNRLPKTRSGKILRGTIKKIADGGEYRTPATIDDPAILPEISQALGTIGFPRSS